MSTAQLLEKPSPRHLPSGQEVGALGQSSSRRVDFRNATGLRRLRALVAIGVLMLAQFGWWFADSDHVGYLPLYLLLTFSLVYKLLRMVHEWYHYVNVREPLISTAGSASRLGRAGRVAPLRTVDMLTTACPGEPHAMIVRTLEALVAVRYPHTTYLCDEGDEPELRAVCARLGVVHVTRRVKVNAKAGNINNALQQATGELCVVLDPDHEVTPDFLDQVLPYFDDDTVGYVQVVQAYGNQADSLVAQGAAEQTYHFYGPLMMSMNAYNTVQSIGANCTFRRAALDSIGGHAAGLTEDMHTAMRLHAAGWKSVYAPVVVSRGLVPSTLGAFYMQQLKWARGTFDLLFHVYPQLFWQFSWRQRLHYLTMPLYFLSGVVAFIDIVVPVSSLLLLQFPWHLSLPEFALHLLPVTVIGLLIRYQAQSWLREPHEPGLHLVGGLLRISSWWVYTLGLVYTVLNVRVPYLPTPKEGGRARNEWLLSLPNLGLLIISVGAAVVSMQVPGMHGPYTELMALLALVNAGILLLAVLMAQQRLLDNLRTLFRTVFPFPALKQAGKRRLSAGAGLISRELRRSSLVLAAVLVVVHTLMSAGLLLVREQRRTAISDAYIWAHTGYGPLHIGQPLAAKNRASATLAQGGLAALPARSRLVGIELSAGTPPQVPVATIEEINRRGDIPVLTWAVAPTARGSHRFQQQVGHLLKTKNQLLLRPLLPAASPGAYRAAWQQLVKSYRAAGDTTNVWVWTPPHPDSIAAYFPGSAYVTWMASDCRAAAPNSQALASRYQAFRGQVARQIEMQSKPILLFVPQAYEAQARPWAQQVATRYPEVKAVLFQAQKLRTSTPSK